MKKKIIILIFSIVCFVQFLLIGINLFKIHQVNSIGIIGCADGPTSILISNHSGKTLEYCAIGLIFIITVTVLLYLLKHKKPD